MKIAVLSGKGGTGKTFVATNLAAVLPSAVYADCDVEEPNGHIFLHPSSLASETVFVPVPVVNAERCTACRACVDFCRYNALALIGGTIKVFEDICHNCGGCSLVCPEKAITEKGRAIGTVNSGTFGKGRFFSGLLNPGEASGVPVIEAVLNNVEEVAHDNVVIDCPPGSACVVMESIKNADFCLLVAEPTLFGAHNLHMVHELVTLFKKPYAVLLNKNIPGTDNPSSRYCQRFHLPILGEIPYLEDVARMNAKGDLAVKESALAHELFTGIARTILDRARDKTARKTHHETRDVSAKACETCADTGTSEAIDNPTNTGNSATTSGSTTGNAYSTAPHRTTGGGPAMKQLLVLSGKGGTGKTTVASAFIAMSSARACADCDVDAPNLHFVMNNLPVAETEPFYGLEVAHIDAKSCDSCGLCQQYCRFGAIVKGTGNAPSHVVNTPACEGCGVCESVCPQKAIAMVRDQAGEMTLHRGNETVFSTARLKMGKGNSGLLVTQVKRRMQANTSPGTPLAIIDGSPGIGCPVIASLNNVHMVLLVVEPTLSGISDMKRVVATARRFSLPMAVCVNRHTISDHNTAAIERLCHEQGLYFAGKIPYDPQVVQAINCGRPIMDFDCPASRSLKKVFAVTMDIIQKQENVVW